MRQFIVTTDAPKAVGTYSQGVVVGKLLYTAGQLGLDPQSGDLVPGGFTAQLHQVLKNLEAVARRAGSSLQNTVRFTVYLTKEENFSDLNTVMAEYLRDPYPARSTVVVSALAKGAVVELDAIIQLP